MPRRSGGGGYRGGSPSRNYSRPSPPPPPPKPIPPANSARQNPSFLRQAAAVGTGVAAGTIIGHTVLAAMAPRERQDYYNQTYARATPRQLQEDACGDKLARLVSCMTMAQNANLDVMEVCSTAENIYLDCLKTNGDPTY